MPTLKVNEIIAYSGNTLSLGTSGNTVTLPANVTFNALSGNVYIPNGIIKLDAITVSATTTFNLTYGGSAYSPASANACLVSVNGVIQTPGTAFTISGSQIIFTSALSATDTINFIIVLAAPYTLNVPGGGTVGFNEITSNLITGATAETSIAGGDLVLIYDDSATALRKMTRTNFVAGLSLSNTPAFNIEKTSLQTLTSDVLTKIQFNNSIIDTASGWSGVNYRYTIPSGQGGYWFISLTGNAYSGSNNVGDFRLELHKNGARVAMKQFYSFTDDHRHEPLFLSALLNLSASDYLEGFALIQGTSPTIREDANETFLMGFRLAQ